MYCDSCCDVECRDPSSLVGQDPEDESEEIDDLLKLNQNAAGHLLKVIEMLLAASPK